MWRLCPAEWDTERPSTKSFSIREYKSHWNPQSHVHRSINTTSQTYFLLVTDPRPENLAFFLLGRSLYANIHQAANKLPVIKLLHRELTIRLPALEDEVALVAAAGATLLVEIAEDTVMLPVTALTDMFVDGAAVSVALRLRLTPTLSQSLRANDSTSVR